MKSLKRMLFAAAMVASLAAAAQDPAPAPRPDATAIALQLLFGIPLIGGALIDAGDVVIDGSVRGKLERLQSALSN